MSVSDEACKIFRIIIHYNDEQRCEVDVNLETYKKIQSRDPETLQALFDAYKDSKPELVEEVVYEGPLSVQPQEASPEVTSHVSSLWTEELENCLLISYRKHSSHHQKWKQVEQEMRRKGYMISGEQCRDRWRKIAKRYLVRQKWQRAGKCGVEIPELWEECFHHLTNSDQLLLDLDQLASDVVQNKEAVHVDDQDGIITGYTRKSKDPAALQALLKALRESKSENASESLLESTTHIYAFWNAESEALLLESYFKHSSHSQKWKKVEEDMRRNGIMITAEKCRDKWRRLEKKYQRRWHKQMRRSRRYSTEISQLWETCFGPGSPRNQTLSDDLQSDHYVPEKRTARDDINGDEALGYFESSQKDIKPSSCSSQQLQKCTVTKKRTAADGLTSDEFTENEDELTQEDYECTTHAKTQPRKHKRQSSVGKVIKYLKSRDQVITRLHEEHNQLLRELLNTLKTMKK